MSDTVEITLSSEQQEGTESVVANWFKKPGDTVKEHEPIVEINTDKVSVEISAPASGILIEIIKQTDEKISPGDVLGRIQSSDSAQITKTAESSKPTSSNGAKSSQPKSESNNAAELTPAVRRLLKEKGLDASCITGTGPNGRILIEDVENYSAKNAGTNKSSSSSIRSNKVPHTAIRKSIASHMVTSLLKTAPHVTTVFDCDLSAIISHRNANKDKFQEKGVKLTFTPYFIQAAVEGLKAMPALNSRWHDDFLEVYEDYNIGIATSLEQGGLIVPVVKNAQTLDLFGIASQLQDLTTKARSNSLSTADVQGGTFTISNHGMTGSLIATPIINQPQSGILGIGKLEKRPVVIEQNGKDELVIKPMVYVTLTFDHRVMDGVQGNAFLARFVETIQSGSF
jgi:2-oxoglutarate dehydrogenase E2 component (dihydrolipoamide succinyltransferase)